MEGSYLDERDLALVAAAGLHVPLMQCMAQTLPEVLRDQLDLGGGAYIAGGSLVRALGGTWKPEEPPEARCDVDVWVKDLQSTMKLLGPTHRRPTWAAVDAAHTTSHEAGRIVAPSVGSKWSYIDVVGRHFGPPEEVCGRFDFRCSMLAYDGKRLWAADGALDDIRHRRMVPMRRTRAQRLRKYEGLGMGFQLTVPWEDAVLGNNATLAETLGSEPIPVGHSHE
jgi:hypothetical protein